MEGTFKHLDHDRVLLILPKIAEFANECEVEMAEETQGEVVKKERKELGLNLTLRTLHE